MSQKSIDCDQPSHPSSILVVDDNEGVRQVLKRLLERKGHEVLQACHGQDALQVFDKDSERIGLAMINVSMPVMGGCELSRALNAHHRALPIILMSGLSEALVNQWHPDMRRFTTFLAKPFSADMLYEMLENVYHPGPL